MKRIVLPLLLSGVACSAMPIYEDGQEKAVIVVPDSPAPVTMYAGQELVRYLNTATQGDFKLKKESEVMPNDGPFRIYVGASQAALKKGVKLDQLAKNHFVVYPSSEALYLVGRDDAHAEAPIDDAAEMGSLLAVYDWLDRSVGVRWVWPGELGTEVPSHQKLHTTEGPPVQGKPAVTYSRLRYYAPHYNPERPSPYGRSKSFDDKSYLRTNEWFRRHKVYRTAGERAFYGHSFGEYWKKYGKEHPEFFALRPDGKRGPIDERTNLTQLCVSNPALHKTIIAEWLRTRTPERPWINACENDRRTLDPSCHCADCKAWDVPDAVVSVEHNPWLIESRAPDRIDPYEKVSMTDRYMRFLLALLKEGKKHDPKAKVVGYAYTSYSDPPRVTKLNEDVVIIVVPPYIYPLEKGKEEIARKLWDGWKATGATLIYRPNDFLVGYPTPYIYANQFGHDFKHYLDHGMIATKFDSFTGMWGTQGPNLYMLGRLHSRPDLSPESILDEYYSIFGPAKEAVKSYFQHWERTTAKCSVDFQLSTKGGWNYMMVAPQLIFTPDAFDEGRRLLKEAAQAANADPHAKERVEFLRIWLDYSSLATDAVALYRKINANSPKEQRQAFSKALEKLRHFRTENEATFIGADASFIRTVEPWGNWKE